MIEQRIKLWSVGYQGTCACEPPSGAEPKTQVEATMLWLLYEGKRD